jgi:GAF domain-containing protein
MASTPDNARSGPDDPPPGDTGWAAAMAEFARELRTRRMSVTDTITDILARSVKLVDDADSGCVTTLRRGVRSVVACTDPVADELCRLQYESGEGPIDDELWHADTVVSADLETETRWPSFAAVAVDSGIRSLAAFRLYTGQGDLGALVLYSRTAYAFGTDAVIVGQAIAAHAAIAMLAAGEREQYETALASRDIIGQAKGMLMERYDLDAVAAFDLLTALSQSENIPLRRIAQSLVDAEHPINSVTDRPAR